MRTPYSAGAPRRHRTDHGRDAVARLKSGARTAEGVRTGAAIREAAADLFYERGYEATSLREVAARAGLQVGSLYNHISGKEELLVAIMADILEDLLEAQENALDGKTDTLDRLHAFISTHIRFHAERARDVFIGNSELRSLSKANRRRVVSLRTRYEELLRSLVEELARTDGERIFNVRVQTYAVLALGAHVSSWYDPAGPMTLDELAEAYTRVAFRQLGVGL